MCLSVGFLSGFKLRGKHMKTTSSEFSKQAIEVVRRRIRPQRNSISRPEELADSPTLQLGRVVCSPKYGKGYIAGIEENPVKVRVRFWRHGCKYFYQTESGFPFELTSEVRLVKRQSVVEKVLARETSAEKRERGFRCQHGDIRVLCLRCPRLPAEGIEHWKKYRTRERRIRPSIPRGNYVPVRISTNDCSLITRSPNGVSEREISDWFECVDCGRTYEVAANRNGLAECPNCKGKTVSIAEPFQATCLSPDLVPEGRDRDQDEDEDQEDGSQRPKRRPRSVEEAQVIDLFNDPRSGFQPGGTGYMRQPLDAPRETRAESPEWLHRRADFLRLSDRFVPLEQNGYFPGSIYRSGLTAKSPRAWAGKRIRLRRSGQTC
jgi:hypothetical protein